MTPAYKLREIILPKTAAGKLYAASMPGYYSRDFDDDRTLIQESGVDTVVSLVPLVEMARLSPIYARALQNQQLPWRALHLPIEDYGVPEDRDALLQMVRHIAAQLHEGDWVMVHCAAGIGRTGMFSTILLMALGLSLEEAQKSVKAAGAGSESNEQTEFLKWAESALSEV